MAIVDPENADEPEVGEVRARSAGLEREERLRAKQVVHRRTRLARDPHLPAQGCQVGMELATRV